MITLEFLQQDAPGCLCDLDLWELRPEFLEEVYLTKYTEYSEPEEETYEEVQEEMYELGLTPTAGYLPR